MPDPSSASPTARRNLIVVGTSAGGGAALDVLVRALPADLPAAVCIVQHLSPDGESVLPQLLDRVSALPVGFAEDGEAVSEGRIYVAPPDQHLLVRDGRIRLTRGPKENRARPAVDPLFRSAAVDRGTAVIGVILTGMLDDGASGLRAVRRCGGVTVVQDPADARYPEMPEHALECVEADYVLPLDRIGPLLAEVAGSPAPAGGPPPADIVLEARIAEHAQSEVETEDFIGTLAPLSCPDCGGPLWEMKEADGKRYRCHVGHGYTALALLAGQHEVVERALWAALRTMEERTRMLRRLARTESEQGRPGTAHSFAGSARESEAHVAVLRELLLKPGQFVSPASGDGPGEGAPVSASPG